MNICSFLGRLGADPDYKLVGKNKDQEVCEFSLAVDNYGEDDPLWLRVTVWGTRGEFAANNLAKGLRVAVSGTLRLEEWEGKDGEARTTLRLNCQQLSMVDWAEKPDEKEAEKKKAYASKYRRTGGRD